MKPSPNPNLGEKPKTVGRKAPRRTIDAADKTSAGYDSADFPVLLRMPELQSQVNLAANESETGGVATPAVVATVQTTEADTPEPTVPQHRRHSKHSPSSREKNRIPAKAARQFWNALAPKAAIGGMLLSLTALCVVVLQDPSADTTTNDAAPRWTADKEHETTDNDLVAPVTSPVPPYAGEPAVNSTAEHTLASKPDRPVSNPGIIPPALVQETPSAPFPVDATPRLDVNTTTGWPTDNQAVDVDSTSLDTPSTGSYRASGWPDDVDSRSSNDSASELELNPAVRSAMRQGRSPATARPRLDSGVGARLDGTVEIPKPQSDLILR